MPRLKVAAFVVAILTAGTLVATQLLPSAENLPLPQPAPQVGSQQTSPDPGAVAPISQQHNIEFALKMAKDSLARLDEVADYRCTFIKRERIKGKLLSHEYMNLKVRHDPFSVYIYCLGPNKAVGEEAIYIEGQNDGKVLGHTTGLTHKVVGTVKLAPDSMMLMNGNLHPITDTGMQNLLRKLISSYTTKPHFDQAQVTLRDDVLDERPVQVLEVALPEKLPDEEFHRMQVYFDRERQIPLRFERYDWVEGEAESQLIEEYTYRDVELNVGLTDTDFSTENPEYGYK